MGALNMTECASGEASTWWTGRQGRVELYLKHDISFLSPLFQEQNPLLTTCPNLGNHLNLGEMLRECVAYFSPKIRIGHFLAVHRVEHVIARLLHGDHTAPIFLATVGDPARFRSQSSFANYCGIVPGASQSAGSEAKGLRMTKAGPAIMRWALFQAGGIGRAHDPQLACVYYREMVHNGKNHMQAMGAVMSHMSARILAVLREDKPYDLRDMDGRPVSREEARKIILSKYQVPEEIRRERRHRKTPGNFKLQKKLRETLVPRTREAAAAPQPVVT